MKKNPLRKVAPTPSGEPVATAFQSGPSFTATRARLREGRYRQIAALWIAALWIYSLSPDTGRMS